MLRAQAAPRTDRRHVRRAATIEHIVDVAVDVMAEHGVAGLSLGEVARRVGVRPPSLYVYFDSKNAIYDAVFARGWQRLAEVMDEGELPAEPAELPDFLLATVQSFVRWNVEHPVYAQLMIWRPVPGYEPSAQAYAPAVTLLDRSREVMARLQELGLLRRDVDTDELLRVWTVLSSGVVSQQLANAPNEAVDSGTFTSLLPDLVSMFLTRYAATPSTAPLRGRGHHADRRRPGR